MSVSIIVPIRNRPVLVDACLQSLQQVEEVGDDLEIIVVDDASSDDTAAVAEEWADRLPLRVIRNPRQVGPGAARNIGAQRAHGEILAFIDGDCRADRRWLADLLPAFQDESVVAVGGGLVSASEATWVQRYESIMHPSQRGRVEQEVRPGSANDFLPGCNILVRRQAFRSIGGFDTTHHLGEDVDLTWRLADQAGRVLYRPNGVVAHEHVDRLWHLLRRRFDLGTSHAVLLRRHPGSRRGFVASVPQLGVALCLIAAISRQWFAGAAAAVLSIDLAAAVQRSRSLPRRAVVLACFKGYLSVALQGMTLIDQYFVLPLLMGATIGTLFWSPLLIAFPLLAANTGVVSLVEWIRLRPSLGVGRYLAVRTLDRIAVHLGILAGCFVHGTLRPLQLRVRMAPLTIDLLRYGHTGTWMKDDPVFSRWAQSPAESTIDDSQA